MASIGFGKHKIRDDGQHVENPDLFSHYVIVSVIVLIVRLSDIPHLSYHARCGVV